MASCLSPVHIPPRRWAIGSSAEVRVVPVPSMASVRASPSLLWVICARRSTVTGTVNCPADTGGSGVARECSTRWPTCGLVHRDNASSTSPGQPGPRVRGDRRGDRSRAGEHSCPSYTPGRPGSRHEVMAVPEDPQADATPDTQSAAAADTGRQPTSSIRQSRSAKTRPTGRPGQSRFRAPASSSWLPGA